MDHHGHSAAAISCHFSQPHQSCFYPSVHGHAQPSHHVHGHSSAVKDKYPQSGLPCPYPVYGKSQPGCVYPNPPPYNVPPSGSSPQRQQQKVVCVGGGQSPQWSAVAQTPQPQVIISMVGAFVLSCFVFWLFGIVLGGIAFILAAVGYNASAGGDTLGAIRLRNASYGVSIAGIVCGIIVIGIVAGLANSYVTYSCFTHSDGIHTVCS